MPEHESNTRKTVTVNEAPFQRCDTLKRSDESWSDFLHRAADALESTDNDSEHEVNTARGVGIDDEVYDELRKLQELVETLPATTAEQVRREFEENYRP